MAKTPITNTQYAAFVQATSYKQPEYWIGGKLPPASEGRVLRGGTFVNDRRNVRCACRVGFNPKTRRALIGFQVMMLL
jgi:formylglycine-generating enzyme required for sulfatase activity